MNAFYCSKCRVTSDINICKECGSEMDYIVGVDLGKGEDHMVMKNSDGEWVEVKK